MMNATSTTMSSASVQKNQPRCTTSIRQGPIIPPTLPTMTTMLRMRPKMSPMTSEFQMPIALTSTSAALITSTTMRFTSRATTIVGEGREGVPDWDGAVGTKAEARRPEKRGRYKKKTVVGWGQYETMAETSREWGDGEEGGWEK